MKKPLTLFALPLTVVAVAACGGSGHKATATTKNAAATTTPTQAAPPPTTTTTTTAAPPAAPAPAATHTVNLAADPSGQLKYTQTKLSTASGKVTVDFTNKSPLPHDVVLIDSAGYSAGAKVLGQTPIFQGGTKSFTATLTPGTYYYYCSVPGHRQAGMQGTLTVTGSGGGAAAAPKPAGAKPASKPAAPKTASKPAAPKPASKPATAASTIDLAADPSGMLKFTQTHLSVKAGKVTVDFTNKSPLPHDVVLIDSASYSAGAKVLGQTAIFQGGTKSFTATLTPGMYYYYCSVPGHRQAGMQGTLTVS